MNIYITHKIDLNGDLTLTRVVFEYDKMQAFSKEYRHLTLTRVVFESCGVYAGYEAFLYLTLTRVVFEYMMLLLQKQNALI